MEFRVGNICAICGNSYRVYFPSTGITSEELLAVDLPQITVNESSCSRGSNHSHTAQRGEYPINTQVLCIYDEAGEGFVIGKVG